MVESKLMIVEEWVLGNQVSGAKEQPVFLGESYEELYYPQPKVISDGM